MTRTAPLPWLGLALAVGIGTLAAPSGWARTETPAPLPRLTAEATSGQHRGHLVNAATGERFTPRGANYVRLTEVAWSGGAYHSTFEPGRYTGAEADRVLAALAADGHNAVRVFVDPGSRYDAEHGVPHGVGRGAGHDEPYHGPYLDNTADFLRRAAAHRVRVLLTFERIAENAHYDRMTGGWDSGEVPIEGHNNEYLNGNYLKAKAAYLRNFVTGLRQRAGDALTAVLAYQTDNEAYVVGDQGPFNRVVGRVRTADGNSYDMADAASRQQAQDANMTLASQLLGDAIREADPKALVTTGFFTYAAVGKPGPQGLPARCQSNCSPGVDYRYPVRPAVLRRHGRLDFLDLHLYPVDQPLNSPYQLDRDLASSEFDQVGGVIVLGEYGAFREAFGHDVVRAAHAMRELQVQTCEKGLTGWLYWTYDTRETADQRRIFTLTDNNGAINGQLAPRARPDPCD